MWLLKTLSIIASFKMFHNLSKEMQIDNEELFFTFIFFLLRLMYRAHYPVHDFPLYTALISPHFHCPEVHVEIPLLPTSAPYPGLLLLDVKELHGLLLILGLGEVVVVGIDAFVTPVTIAHEADSEPQYSQEPSAHGIT